MGHHRQQYPEPGPIYTWPDSTTTSGAVETETGGTRYLVAGGVGGSINAGGGGTITFTTQSHDYWPNTSGICVQSTSITGVTATATGGFSAAVSGATVTVSRGKNMTTSVVSGTIDFSKAGFVSASGSGNSVGVSQAANSYTTSTYWDGSTYWHAACSGYDSIDYQQVRPQYNWATGDITYGDWINGSVRNRGHVDGQCGWVGGWTNWAHSNQTCDREGNAGGYNCDGTYTLRYYRDVRYLKYPDGSIADTQYQVGVQASRREENGVCGYSVPRYYLTNPYGRDFVNGNIGDANTYTSVKKEQYGVVTDITNQCHFENYEFYNLTNWISSDPSGSWTAGGSMRIWISDKLGFWQNYDSGWTIVKADIYYGSVNVDVFQMLVEKEYGSISVPYPPTDL